MEVSQLHRLKELEEENRKLKQMYADLSLEHKVLKDIVEKKVITVSDHKRLAREAIEENQVSERQASRYLCISQSVFRYQSKKAGDGEIIELLVESAEQKPRWGFKKMNDYLKNQGYQWNHKKVHRIYQEMGLNLQ